MERQKANLAPFAMYPKVFDSSSLLQIAGLQLRRFLPTQAVVKQHSQNGPITQPLERFSVRRIEQLLGLVIT
ncbi:hypothetical protein ALO82_200143 [Pseudomonas syringae pv. broussonetiae]|nr:hypothetical protein ALO82_200143 [Pseudomonas syringae pv. broussonetiae]